MRLQAGISKSEVSRICADLEAFRARPLEHAGFPYVFLGATYLTGRVGSSQWSGSHAAQS